MDWVVTFVGEVVLWGVGALSILLLTFGLVRAAPVKKELLAQHPHDGRLYYQHNGCRYISTGTAQSLGGVVLAVLSLVIWGF